MSDTSLQVVVIGGGIGGLCLAQGLKKAGVPVSVYERDRTPTSRLQGYRIHVSPRGARSLRECLPSDLWDAFEASCGTSPHSFRFMTHRMDELLRIDTPGEASLGRHYSASRGRLRQVLLAGLDDIVQFEKAFTRYEELSDGRVRAFFEDGSSAKGDVLVAADGGNSRVRKQLFPAAQRAETGIRALGGKIVLTRATRSSLPAALLQCPTLVRAPGGRAVFLAVQEFGEPDGTKGGADPDRSTTPPAAAVRFDDETSYLMWALSARGDRSGFPPALAELEGEALRELALKACSSWHPDFSTMIRMTDPSSIGVTTIRTSVPVEPWPSGRITLIGDAIHSMTPYRGIGGNVALRDASLLGRNLAAAHRGEKPLVQAIHEYESAMLDYGFRAVRNSLQAALQVHAEGNLAFFLGNLFFRIVNAMPPLKARMMRGDADD
jgi:2-polyprenyl-6-methoxyphenol hydroxylase-like FAD-dependent oxidoreductase